MLFKQSGKFDFMKKKNMFKKVFNLFILILLSAGVAHAQFENPVKWSVSAKSIDHEIYEINIQANIGNGFDIYSHNTPDDLGPIPTVIHFEESKDFVKVGELTFRGEEKIVFDPIWEAEVGKFSKKVVFVQKVRLLKDQATVSGYYEAQACDDEMCFPPDGNNFKLNLKKKSPPLVVPSDESKQDTPQSKVDEDEDEGVIYAEVEEVDESLDSYDSEIAFNWDKTNQTCVETGDDYGEGGLWIIFTLGFLGGVIALLTPCVFPMIPLTVSYFTKGAATRKEGIQQAFLYGISIIVIYLALGLSVTLIFGADALNVMSTSAFFNILFFIIFVIFALSFFGLFEITLPASWANKTDQLSDKGGVAGIFFMAFTLALVSFSCTGPIIGSLLVQAATDVGPSIGVLKVKPIIGMLGFSMALALPFTLFALFPQWLSSLPKSGGWLEKVKVNLGLLELAFAFKFLSIVDLTRGWGILRWELFMGIWIVIFLFAAVYSFGLFSKEKTPTPIKAFGLVSLLFALFMLNNTLAYKPVPILSGISPSSHYNFFNKNVLELSNTKDFDEALAMAKEQNKPILIDFSGYGCVNCRKMEEQVWVKDDIRPLLGEFVIASLYVDDRTPLPESEQYQSTVSGKLKDIKTIGNKWTDFEIRHFKKASQPNYVIIDTDLNVLTLPIGYSDASDYKAFLECGLDEFKKSNK
ncbi:MAG TPA: cytochrome c biogenesis protein CcdA [Chitinophagales bacterium]|nr:cytochrome c biogenesis protein CcdA [Chitinophagales bacterium]